MLRIRGSSAWLFYILSTVASSAIVSHAKTPVFSNPVLGVGDRPTGVTAHDVNGDGVLDIVVANWESRDISILLGTGDGFFQPETRVALPWEPGDVVVGDFNSDGRVDLLANLPRADWISVVFGNDDGSFEENPLVFRTGAFPRALVSGDFNEDGQLDAITANFLSDDISVLLGEGNGSFLLHETVPVAARPSSLASGDFNEDGHLDLAIVTNVAGAEGFAILVGQGDGTFWPMHSSPLGLGFDPAMGVGDLNMDGHDDILLADALNEQLFLFRGLGNGSFEEDDRYDLVAEPTSILLLDINADAFPDVVIGSLRSSISVLLSNGDGSLTPSGPLEVGSRTGALAGGDFTASGAMDLAVVDETLGQVTIVYNRDGALLVPERFELGSLARAAVLGDLNHDGLEDLVVSNEMSQDLTLHYGTGNGGFVSPSRFLPLGVRPSGVAVLDLDHDAWNDIAAVSGDTNEVHVLFSGGDGSFSRLAQFPVGECPKALATADFNSDGLQDLATANICSRDVSILLATAAGDLMDGGSLFTGTAAVNLVADDLNADGRADLVAAHLSEGVVRVFFGEEGGTFRSSLDLPVGIAPDALATGDLDRNGVMDIAVANKESLDISLLFGIGDSGLFAPEIRLPVEDIPSAVTMSDLNRDRNLDLLVAGFSNHDLRVFFNEGQGVFSRVERYRTGQRVSALAVADLDRNRMPDVAVVQEFGTLTGPGLAVLLSQLTPNDPPTAIAGPAIRVECSSPEGAEVVLDGSSSFDPDSAPGTNDDLILFEWIEDLGLATETLLGTESVLPVTFPKGLHVVSLRVTDSHGIVDTAATAVLVEDTSPPEVSIELGPAILWPPNHRLVDILAGVHDRCGPASYTLMSVTSSEPDDAPGGGDGSTVEDIQGADLGNEDPTFQLRAERSARGPGRTYYATYQLTDTTGNSATETLEFTVPHNVGGVVEPLMLHVLDQESGTVMSAESPFASAYRMVAGMLENLEAQGGSYRLGQLRCLSAAVSGPESWFYEDLYVPTLGAGVFYLAEYYDGIWSGYGTESAGKNRLVPPGQCPG